MSARSSCIAWGAATIAALSAASFQADLSAQTPDLNSAAVTIAEETKLQQMLQLPVRVVDQHGQPVERARVIPWALRSSQGHGNWFPEDERAGIGPTEVWTDAEGMATVAYPYFRNVQEQVRTNSVSLKIDHPDFAFRDGLHLDVPLESDEPFAIELTEGIPVEIRPVLDGVSADLESIFAFWSDGRSWESGVAPEKLESGTLRIPAMPPGKNSVLLVKLDGERATHFSGIVDFELEPGERKQLEVSLQPARRVQGSLSENVPRPVIAGRVRAWTLNPSREEYRRVDWHTWVPVQPDGTFTIDGWPAGEPIQLIALCDGYRATSGTAPAVVKNPPDPLTDGFGRSQVFHVDSDAPIELAMTRLGRCEVTALDEDLQPVAGVTLESWPNVGWWNDGSQLYCYPLVRGESLLRVRDYQFAIDKAFPYPFEAVTDGQGKATLELPVGNQRLALKSDVYELPVFLGSRDAKVKLAEGEIAEVTLHLQAAGTDRLGEWDKLAGVVFGCSTREGRRICALPGIQKRMNEFEAKFRDGANRRDPKLLSEAFATVAEAFEGVGDLQEAAKWRAKSIAEARKISGDKPQ